MMKICTVAFFGHRHISNPLKVEEALEQCLRKLINENEYIDFLVGRNGEFDQCVSSAISRIQKSYRDDNSSHILVLGWRELNSLRLQKENFR